MAVAVSLDKVIEAFALATSDSSSFVDTSTGEVRSVLHDELHMAEEGPDDDLSTWEREGVAQAREILDSDDWIELPNKSDIHEWAIMDRFASDVAHADNRAELRDALRGAGAFRRFKEAVYRLNLQDEWFRYRTARLEDIARKWLADHNLVATT